MADEKDKAQEKRRFEEAKQEEGISLNDDKGMSGGESGAGKSGKANLQSSTPDESSEVREDLAKD